MSMKRSPLTVLLAVALLLPAGAALAQDDGATPAAEASADPRIEELAALVPPALAGLPLADNLQFATGEQLFGVMQPAESEIIQGVLDETGTSVADYAAVTTFLQPSENEIVVIQAHRIEGIDASQTVDAWVEVLSMNLEEPSIEEGFIGGRPVTLISDTAVPEIPLLHLFPAGDVMWMIVAADAAIVEEAMGLVGAEDGAAAEEVSEDG